MPNWCSNKLSITAQNAEQIAELEGWYAYVSADDYRTDTGKGFFYRVLPTPPNMTEREAVGTQAELWGTKWEVWSFANTDYKNGSLVLEFDTAWSPPMGICMELARRGYLIRLEYFEPGMSFGGVVENNNNIFELAHIHSDNIENPKDEVRQEIDDTFGISDWYGEAEEDYLPTRNVINVKDDDQDQLINNGGI